MSTYLLTRPDHDDTTHYLFAWVGETIPEAENKGVKVIDLYHKRAVRKEVENIINKVSPDFVVFNGHGDENTVTGHNRQPIIIAGENESMLHKKIIYAISCSSAKNLGQKAVNAGASSYTGYDDDFVFFYEPENLSRPLKDKTAKIFLEHSNLFITSIIKGNSVSEAKKKAELLLKNNIVKLLGRSDVDAQLVRYLWWDLRHFVSHGNENAVL